MQEHCKCEESLGNEDSISRVSQAHARALVLALERSSLRSCEPKNEEMRNDICIAEVGGANNQTQILSASNPRSDIC